MPKSLLVADDSLTIRKVIGMILAAEDFQITSVDNGLEAVNKARELRPDLVLADVMMPGKSGYEVCEALKADPSTKAIPVLLLAGNFEPFDEHRAKSVKADDYLVKPFESQSLLDKVRTLTGLPKEPETPRQIFMPESAAQAPKASMAVPEPSRPAISIPIPVPTPTRPNPVAASAGRAGQPSQFGQPGAPRSPVPTIPPAASVGRTPMPARAPTQMARSATIPQYRMPPNAMPRAAAPMPPSAAVARPPAAYGPARGAPYPNASPVQPYAQGPINVGAGYARMPPTAAARVPGPAGYPGSPQAHPMGARTGAPVAPGSAPYYGPAVGAYPAPAAQPHRPQDDGGEAMLREALSRASRDVIEKIAWEIVPQLAETIIREHLDQLIKDRSGRS